MKTMIWLKVVCVLAMCGLVNASVTLTDDFSSGLGNWTYVGDAPSTAAGNMYIPNGTQVILAFPGSLGGTLSEISFDISTGVVIGWEGDYDLIMDFRDYTMNSPWGVGYYYKASTTSVPSYLGGSGFGWYDATETRIPGLAGADLGINAEVSRLTISFDPVTGLSVKQDGVVVIQHSNFRSIDKITEFRLQSWAGIPWIIDNVVATYNTPIPEPASIALLSIGFLLLKGRKE